MSSVNLHTREIAIKVVYYGPGLGGKTSSLQFIHRALKPDSRGQLVSLATGVDRTLYFDFLPVKLPKLRGFSVRVQLYTVPGQVHYNSTRKLVLTGADGVVFVADSQRERASANVESLENLIDNLREQGLSIKALPVIIQYNKRDVPDPLPVSELEAKLNPLKVPQFETIATRGVGIFEALKSITTLVLTEVRKKGSVPAAPGSPESGSHESIPAMHPGYITPPVSPSMEGRAHRNTILPVSAPEAAGMSMSSLGEVADAISRLSSESLPARGAGNSGVHRLPPLTSSARTLSDLIVLDGARDLLVKVETDIEKGDWSSAVQRAGSGFRELSTRLAGSLAGDLAAEGPLAALLTNLPASRYLRFREAEARVRSGGAVTSADALFALFFLTDFALRADDLRSTSG